MQSAISAYQRVFLGIAENPKDPFNCDIWHVIRFAVLLRSKFRGAYDAQVGALGGSASCLGARIRSDVSIFT